jgi:hypothetical protein
MVEASSFRRRMLGIKLEVCVWCQVCEPCFVLACVCATDPACGAVAVGAESQVLSESCCGTSILCFHELLLIFLL